MLSTISIIAVGALAAMLGTISTEAPPQEAQQPAAKPAAKLALLSRLIYAVTLLAMLVLAFTGLGYMLILRQRMTGWALMLHATAAPAFVIGLTLLSLAWAHSCRYTAPSGFCAGQKTMFWLMLVVGLGVILSAVLPMLPLLGTPGQELLFHTHQWCSLAMVVLTAMHAFSLVKSR